MPSRLPHYSLVTVRRGCLLTLVYLLTIASIARGQDNLVNWTIQTEESRDSLKPGSSFHVDLIATIAPGWHVYAMTQAPGGPTPTHIELPQQQVFALNGAILVPPAKNHLDAAFQMETQYYEDKAVFRVPLTVAVNAHPGEQNLLIDAHYQVCNNVQCIRPKTVRLTKVLTVGHAAVQ